MWLQPLRPLVFVGESMSPTYPNRSVAWSRPAWDSFGVGDVVVVKTPTGRIVKRVAYMPGDTMVQWYKGDLYVDAISSQRVELLGRVGWTEWRHRVPKGRVYLLGDNSTRSVDSREVGLFRIEDVERVVLSPLPGPGDGDALMNTVRPEMDAAGVAPALRRFTQLGSQFFAYQGR